MSNGRRLRTGGAIDYRLKEQAETGDQVEDIDDLHRELRELRDAVARLAPSN